MEKHNGHAFGFTTLKDTLKWSLELGVSTVTVYAFSIENFKRPQTEIDTIMSLAHEHLHSLLKEEELIHQHGVRIQALGKVSMLPEHIQHALGKAVYTTRNNTKSTLNVCIAYTSREEMLNAASTLADAVQQGTLDASDITEDLFEKCLYMEDKPDILIRTSGEIRLSDFLLWQVQTHLAHQLDEALNSDYYEEYIYTCSILPCTVA
jgi:ditrans,polycis-polyprenyl diphosphate synthase